MDRRALLTACGFALAASSAFAQVIADSGELDRSPAMMRPVIERFEDDRTTLERSWMERVDTGGGFGRRGGATPLSPKQFARMKKFYADWQKTLLATDFDKLDQAGKVDYLLLANQIRFEVRNLDIREKEMAEIASMLPMAKVIYELDEARRAFKLINAEQSAKTLDQMQRDLKTSRALLEKSTTPPSREVAVRATLAIGRLRNFLKDWSEFYTGYDPLFTWWTSQSYKDTDKELDTYSNFIRDRFGSSRDGALNTSVVNPVGREVLMAELEREWIPYTPEELIQIANAEFAWCDREMLKASREMGFGDDWHKALEKVKTMIVPPGGQPEMIRGLVMEGADYVEKNDLVTVPPLAKETWRMQMMTPQRQLVNPFFTGGESISVSYPVDSMTFEQKMMSMRGNNLPFSRSTAFHEMIPGHQLQGFMSSRYRQYRGLFGTPFWGEGYAFYFERLFWEMGFPRTAEERVGMLFWRMHRCARIIFSYSYHLGKMTPQQAIDFLVERVGHERDNATGEVRRSFDGSYAPLYQSAYMLGALQIHAMHKELVDTKKMANRPFHDFIFKANRIPIEMIHAELTNQKLTRDYKPSWKFYGPIPQTP